MAETKGVDILPLAKSIKDRRALLKQMTKDLREETTRFVLAMAKAEIPIRDTAFLLGITPQRVSQLTIEGLANG